MLWIRPIHNFVNVIRYTDLIFPRRKFKINALHSLAPVLLFRAYFHTFYLCHKMSRFEHLTIIWTVIFLVSFNSRKLLIQLNKIQCFRYFYFHFFGRTELWRSFNYGNQHKMRYINELNSLDEMARNVWRSRPQHRAMARVTDVTETNVKI